MLNKTPDIDFEEIRELALKCYKNRVIHAPAKRQVFTLIHLAELCCNIEDFPLYLKEHLKNDCLKIKANLEADLHNDIKIEANEFNTIPDHEPTIIKLSDWGIGKNAK